MLIKEAASQLAPYGIRVNGLSPGIVGEEITPDSVAPMGRSATPSEVSQLVITLLDDGITGHVTGVNWVMDGGFRW